MASKIIKLAQLRKQLVDIKRKGFLQSKRSHDTGIGHTIEHLLGLEENNLSIPDLGKFELKAQRYESASLITLFTKKPDDLLNSEILEKFGYPKKENGQKVIHQTIKFNKQNAKGFKLVNNKEKLSIFKNGVYVFSYNKIALNAVFDRKFSSGVILVLADSKKNSEEKFHFKEAYLMKHGNFENFIKHLYYDIRIGRYPNGSPHDHGSAFRIKKFDLPKIFKVYRKLI